MSYENWSQYHSHKIVRAARIVRRGSLGELIVQPNNDASEETFQASVAAMEDRASIGDYAVVYADGFKSVSPASAFEEGYTEDIAQ